jgi:glycosyltransferase involved in cell wall biosynthesis
MMGEVSVKEGQERRSYAIALICDFNRGLTSRILDVYKHFQHEPHIILARKGERMSTDPKSSVEFVRVPISVIPLETFTLTKAPLVLLSMVAYTLYSVLLFLRLRNARYPVRLVHAHFIFPQGLFGLVLGSLLNVPLVVTAVGSDVNSMLKGNAIFRAACLLVLKRSRVVIAVNPSLLANLRQHEISNCVYIPNSVDMSSIKPLNGRAKEDSILYVGSMTENKRPLVLLKAYEKLIQKLPKATLVMCGDGPQRPRVNREILGSRLERVTLFPRLNEQELNSVRSSATVFVLPSANEGTSLALLEAMAAGEAVIVSRNESHKAILTDERNALMFDLDDEEALAKQMLRAITDRKLRREVSSAAKSLCRTNFSNAKVAKQLEELYFRVMNDDF